MSVVANVALNLDTRGVPAKLRDVQNQAQQTERAVNGTADAIRELATAFAGIQTLKFVFAKTAELESQAKSLQVLTGSAREAKQIISELQQLGAATPFTSTELIDAAKRLQAFGVATENVVDTTRRLADVSGATGAELQGLVTAYGQVQAKGRLQGEELLQFQERGVALQKVLKDEYKLSGDEFAKALEKGRFGADSVEYAIKKLTDAGGKYANGAIAQSDTLQGKFSTLQDAIENLARTVGTVFAPVFKYLIDEATKTISVLTDMINMAAMGPQKAKVLAEARAGKLPTSSINPFDFFTGNTSQKKLFELLGQGNAQAGEAIFKRLAEQSKQGPGYLPDLTKLGKLVSQQPGIKAPATAKPKPNQPPPLLDPKGGGGVDEAARRAKKFAEELKRSLETGDRLGVKFSQQIIQLGAATELEKRRNEIQFEYEDRARQISELKNAEQRTNLTDLNNEIRRLEIIKLQTDELKRQVDEFYNKVGLSPQMQQFGEGQGAFRTDINLMPQNKRDQQIEIYKTQLKELINAENQVKMGAEAIGASFGQAFQGLISGATTAQQAFANLMQSIADHFLNMAAQIITQQLTMIIYGTIMKALGITGGGFGFSGAGPVSGTDAFSGAGVGVQGFNLPSLLPKADGGSVKAATPYLVGERGPELFVPGTSGGVMSNSDLRASMGAAPGAGGGPVLNMSFETSTINGVEYVSRDQLEAAMAVTRRQAARDGASRGMTMTLDRLQQSPSTRRKVGI